jgi:hypothetical protein
MNVDIESLAITMYKQLRNHRAVQIRLAEMGCRVKLDLIMLWLGLISPEQYVRFNLS